MGYGLALFEGFFVVELFHPDFLDFIGSLGLEVEYFLVVIVGFPIKKLTAVELEDLLHGALAVGGGIAYD